MEQTVTMPGYTLHIIKTEKFKNISVSLKFKNTLDRDTVTKRTLLSFMLTSGTKELPSTQDLSIYLEDLYGTRFSTSSSTKGIAHIININSMTINEKFLPEKEHLFEKQIKLLSDILFNPNIDQDGFLEDVVSEKKRELKERLKTNLDDKFNYSLEKLFEIMGKGQPLGISSHGYMEDIDKIDRHDLYQTLQDALSYDMIDIYVVGDVEEDYVKEVIHTYFVLKNRERNHNAAYILTSTNDKVNQVEEKQQIAQSKLNMGYTIDTDINHPDHYKFVVFNGIFGGFSHSKLFKVVREQHSLCYYVSSSYDAFNGIMVVNAGIDKQQYQKATDLIGQELKNMQEGNITSLEFETTKTMIINSVKKAVDDPMGMIATSYVRAIVGKKETIEEYIKKIEAVTLEDVIQVSKKVSLDSIFFLTGKES